MTPHPLNANKTNKGILLLSFLMIFTILLTACGGSTAAQKKNHATSLTMLGNAGGDYPRDFNPYNPSVISGTPGLIYETLLYFNRL
ncbi:MAG TPA: ABC transporter substrate-binding protein, partial [Ktedonobacteraceae bacterium]|nr:ABC transporter substrate-binding protein [Ktedonobacteraceae bacterium]